MQIEITIATLIAVIVMILVAKKPKLFWPILIVGNIVGNGPRLFGHIFWDELITGAVILGTLVRIKISGKLLRGMNDRTGFFLVWVGYMVMESIIGVIVNDDLRIIKWILYYLMLGMLVCLTSKNGERFPFPSKRSLSVLVLITTVIYCSAYIMHGMIFEILFGVPGLGRFMDQFMTEGFLWSGSAIAVFPMLLAMPVAIFAISDASRKVRILAMVSILMMMTVAFYYDSRISWVVIFSILLASFRRIRFAKVVPIVLIFSTVFVFNMPAPREQVGEFFSTIFETTQALWSPGEGDITRQLQFKAGFLRLSDNPKTFFIGDGIYSHRSTIIPHMEELNRLYLPEQIFIQPGHKETYDDTLIFRTTAFTALIVDTGIIGMMLLTLNFIFMACRVVMSKTSDRIMYLTMILLAYMWLTVNNISDVILLYLLNMPNGIIEQLSQDSSAVVHS